MANYCIMRFQKHKKSSIAKVERHQNDREHLKNRAHPERQNKTIKRYQDETMLQTVKRLQKEQEKRTGRKVRKDAVALVEIVLTFSPEMEEHIARNFKEWYYKNTQWLKDTFVKIVSKSRNWSTSWNCNEWKHTMIQNTTKKD